MADESRDWAIHTEALVKQFPGCDAVTGLDLAVRPGSTFGLLGPNGAGKSTTIKMLMGLVTPTSGRASVLGHDMMVDSHEIRARVGYVPERHYIYRWMTVREVIRFTRSFYPTWNDQVCQDFLARYALDPHKKVKQLSHGMVTKLALLLALSHEPKLLLLDEPTTGLDPLIREEFLDGIVELLGRSECTVLFSSHILSDIEKTADTIGIIDGGELLIACPRAQLLDCTKRIEATIRENGCPLEAPRKTVWQHTEGTKWSLTVHGFSQATMEELREKNSVEECSVFDLSLEDIFKDFIKGRRLA